MIKATDLRIGNWVLVCGVEIVIFSMAPTANGRAWGFNLIEGEMPSFYDYECEPIILTPEMLKRCGFEKEVINAPALETWKQYSKGKLTIDEHLDHYVFIIPNNGTVRLDYLHQLQNLYFALTGKELEIKELQTA